MITIDGDVVIVTSEDGAVERFDIGSVEAFKLISEMWLRAGWDTKYVYSFSWLGRPIIQLPEDMFRMQEVIYRVQPDVIIETGIAHGGSLVFYAGLCKAMGRGRVIGIDVEIRAHNRKALEEHDLFEYIDLVEGSSIDETTVAAVDALVGDDEHGLVILDSNHEKAHVASELAAYCQFVGKESYIIACDGIMQNLVGAPRSSPDWAMNNPCAAVEEFLDQRDDFIGEEPAFPFNEGAITERVTYWPDAFIKRVK